MTEMRNLLTLDSGSQRLSVAVGSIDSCRATRSAPADRSSSTLLRLLDACLEAAGITVADIDAVLALSGPGAFTGLRVGLALTQGLHQALGCPAGTLPTLRALAEQMDAGTPVLAVVRVGRNAWKAHRFGAGADRPAIGDTLHLAGGQLLDAADSDPAHPATVVGFGLEHLDAAGEWPDRFRESSPLAPLALRLATRADWDPASLTAPLYLAPPPADPAALGRVRRR